ncbi:MAG TPA: sulfotransferase [Rhizomicrobium sp.]
MLKPRDTVQDALLLRDIQAALKAQRPQKAEELACRAVSAGVVDPLPFFVRAQWWMRQGKAMRAVEDLVHAVALAPRNVALRNSVAPMLIGWQHPREAIVILKEAIRLDPRSLAAHFNLGWAFERAGELAPCREAYARALALDPRHADTLARLAGVAYRQGELDAALDHAERALAVNPAIYNALAARANVALRRKDFAVAEDSIGRLLALENISPVDRADAHGLLGDLRDAEARFGEAFQGYTACNREKIRLYGPQFARGRTFGQFAAALADAFEREPAEDWSVQRPAQTADDDMAHDGPRGHVFLVGFARSGTTLAESVLVTHPGIATLVEDVTLNDPMLRLFHEPQGLEQLKALNGAEADGARQGYWKRVRESRGDIAGKVFVDDNPFYSLLLCIVAKLFPCAKVVFALRDPRDVVLSCFRRRIGVNRPIFELLDLERAAHFYSNTMRLRMRYREKLGLAWHDLRHEALIADFDTEIAALCAFLDVPFVDAMRDFAIKAKDRAIITASAAQISRGLNSEGIGHWRHYREQLAPVFPILAPWVERFGYPAD